MNELSVLERIILAVVILLIVIKTAHYFKKIRRKNLFNWFYFGSYSIIGSQSPESARAKKTQNLFTLILLVLLLIALVIMFMNN